MRSQFTYKGIVLVAFAIAWAAKPLAQAQTVPNYYAGTVAMLEAWNNGHVAFTLNAANAPCQQQFLVNGNLPGAKNFYAMLLTAKASDRPVKAYVGSCGGIDGGGFSYAHVTYLYLE
jgi:hypothetical protein